MGRIAINLQKPNVEIRVQRLRHDTVFSREKSYIMIGCLGGLGRTVSRWMVQRGARRFVFLGRSGTAKPAAKALVDDLEASGARCTVVKGDGCSEKDVIATVAAAEGDIGGVVQAAMSLNVSCLLCPAILVLPPLPCGHLLDNFPKITGSYFLNHVKPLLAHGH